MSKDRRELWPLLDERARDALTSDFADWPDDPLGGDRIEAILADIDHLARSVLRCYQFPSTEGLDGDTDWPWRANRNDGSRRWRPIDPDWVPEPYDEWITTGGSFGMPVKEEPILAPDLRPMAFRLLYWAAAIKVAMTKEDAPQLLRATWRTVTELATMNYEIQAGTAAKVGGQQIMNGIFNGPKGAPSPEAVEATRKLNKRLLADGVNKQASRVRDIAVELGDDPKDPTGKLKKRLQRAEKHERERK